MYIYPYRTIGYGLLGYFITKYNMRSFTMYTCASKGRAPPFEMMDTSFTLSQCTLVVPVYTGMPMECHWLAQCTLGHHRETQRLLAGNTGTPLEKLNWNCPTFDCHWRNYEYCSLHWNTNGRTVTTHTHAHIVKQKSFYACWQWQECGTTSSQWTGL